MNPEEEAFLAAIRTHPGDQRTRLVYADWLDENGQPEKAEFLRLQNEQLVTAERLKQLSTTLAANWLAEVAIRRDVVVNSYSPADKIPLIKITREWTGLGLAEAKALVEQPLPIRLVRYLTPELAERLCAQLRWVADATIEAGLPG